MVVKGCGTNERTQSGVMKGVRCERTKTRQWYYGVLRRAWDVNGCETEERAPVGLWVVKGNAQ
jgi:hypothetical protein